MQMQVHSPVYTIKKKTTRADGFKRAGRLLSPKNDTSLSPKLNRLFSVVVLRLTFW